VAAIRRPQAAGPGGGCAHMLVLTPRSCFGRCVEPVELPGRCPGVGRGGAPSRAPSAPYMWRRLA